MNYDPDSAQSHPTISVAVDRQMLEACRAVCDFEPTRVPLQDAVVIDLEEHQRAIDTNPKYEFDPVVREMLQAAAEFGVRYVIARLAL